MLLSLESGSGLTFALWVVQALHVHQKTAADGKAIHVLSSGLKAGSTWARVETLQACRECCGGQGFLAANRIGPLKNDMDVDVTFEGDNTVMMQQVDCPTCHSMSVSHDAVQGFTGALSSSVRFCKCIT